MSKPKTPRADTPPPGDAKAQPSDTSEPSGFRLAPAERYSLAALSLVQGSLFSWAASVLPWQEWTLFAAAALAAGLAHGCTAIACIAWPRRAPRAWQISSVSALLLLLLVSWQVFTGGSYLAGLYGDLGEGLFAALLAIWGLFVLLTAPTAIWGLVRTRQLWDKAVTPRGSALAGVSPIALLLAGSFHAWNSPQPTRLSVPLAEQALTPISEAVLAVTARDPKPESVRGGGKKVTCAEPIETQLTLIASHRRGSKMETYCVQADDTDQLIGKVAKRIRRSQHGSPVKLDLLTGTAPLAVGPEILAALRLRPGLDGVCLESNCLMPWQLLRRGAFLKTQPLDFLRDLKFGISEPSLRKQLGGGPGELRRVATQSFTVDTRGIVTQLRRLRPHQLPVTRDNVRAATDAAQTHILEAQLKDGKFRYTLNPFSGRKQTSNFNLARQAGTLYALCELSTPGDRTREAIRRGLLLLREHEKKSADGTLAGLVMKKRERELRLSNSALPLVAFLACRERVGDEFDDSIRRLTALVLKLQRDDGGFYPEYSLKKDAVVAGKEPLYAPGQALLALVLLEQILQPSAAPVLADLPSIRRAADKGMAYVAHVHWNHALYPFLFIEENWHCLTARAALSVHRMPAYEQFCIDYVRFKSRLILDEESRVSPEFVGGLGFGNVIPPHNTGAAGFGEALSAAISVKRARNEPIDEERALLKHVFGFLLRQQWTEKNCFGCDPLALGSLSEHTHSPITRIDFVQHAWAALGYEEVEYDG